MKSSSTMAAYLMFAAASMCFGMGMVTRWHPKPGRRALVWLFCGQGLLLLTVATQWKALWAASGVDAAAHPLAITAAVAVVFIEPRETEPGYQFGLTRHFGTREVRPTLRSRYERQIREAAGQEERNRPARGFLWNIYGSRPARRCARCGRSAFQRKADSRHARGSLSNRAGGVGQHRQAPACGEGKRAAGDGGRSSGADR